MKDKKETPPTPEGIEKQVAEFGEVLGFNNFFNLSDGTSVLFNKEKFIELVDKKCNNCLSCKCKKDEKKED